MQIIISQKMMTTPPTFKDTDKLRLKEFCDDLECFIKTERHFVTGSLVISLNAPFGAGKSTFLQMWRQDLIERRKSDSSAPIPILLNSWESDHCGDPLLAIVSGLTNETQKHLGALPPIVKVREAAKDIAWFGLGLLNSFVADATSIDAVAAGDLAERKKQIREGNNDAKIDLLLAYENRMRALHQLKHSLAEAFPQAGSQALVLVDELDRCRPDYAIQYLEAIKHVFEVPQVTFVLAVDKAQLQSSAEVLFGANLNFDEYYRKFAHRNINLPQPSIQSLEALIQSYSNLVLVGNEQRPAAATFATPNQITLKSFEELAFGLKLTPRQIHEMFRIVGHVMAGAKEGHGELFWGFNGAAIFMAGLSLGMPELYRAIASKSFSIEQIGEKLRPKFSDKLYKWWMMLIVVGNTTSDKDADLILTALKKTGILPSNANQESMRQTLGQHANAWGHSGNEEPFQYIYKLLEGLKRFS